MQPIKFVVFIFLILPLLLAGHEGNKKKAYIFTENLGQWHKDVRFKAKIEGATIYYRNNSIHYQFLDMPNTHPDPIDPDAKIEGHNFDAIYLNSNENVSIEKTGSSGFYYNYFIGNDESKWKSKVRTYQKVKYNNLYNGIDMLSYKSKGYLKYDYIVKPGADPSQIEIKYDGVEVPKIEEGNLIIKHNVGELIEQKPFAFQIIEGEKLEVPCSFQIDSEGIVSFHLPNEYDATEELIIDPNLIFSTYTGARNDNWGMTATYDFKQNGYAGGVSFGNSYIQTNGVYQFNYGGSTVDIAISKFYSEGDSLIYATFLGGNRNETIHSMVVDSNNDLFLLGATSSTNFPTGSNAYSNTKSSSTTFDSDNGIRFTLGSDIIVSKLSEDGTTLLGSTYFGGNQTDGINYSAGPNRNLNYNLGDSHRGEIVVDSTGNCYIGTSTSSPALNVNTSSSYSGAQDGIIVKFNSDLSNVVWSRYLGGSQKDAIYSLKVINNNRVLVGGGTVTSIAGATNFPTTSGSYLPTGPGGRADGFISIISANGNNIERSTFIGTTDYDQVYFIEFDRFNGVYAYGQTNNINFPLKNAPVANAGAGQFIVKLDENLDSLIYSTTFGRGGGIGRINISPTAFLVDRCQNVYVSGWGGSLPLTNEGPKTLPTNMPLANNEPRFSNTDGIDFYLYVLNREIDSVLYASYFGGTTSDDHVDGGTSRFDKEGVIYQSVCASCSLADSTDFPIRNAFASRDNSSNCNNAIFKFDFEILPKADVSSNRLIGCVPFTARVRDSSKNAAELIWNFYGSRITNFSGDTTITFTTPGSYKIRQIARDTICDSEDRDSLTIVARPNNIQVSTTKDTTVCLDAPLDLTVFTNNTANKFQWSSNSSFTDTLNPLIDSTLSIVPSINQSVYYVMVSESLTNACEQIDSVRVNYIPLDVSAVISEDTICEGERVNFSSTLQNTTNFKWDFGNSQFDSTNTNPIGTFNIAGDYQISLIGRNNNCIAQDTAVVSLNVAVNNLDLTAIPDTFTCRQDSISLVQNSNGTAQSFYWSSSRNFTDTLNNSKTDSVIKVFSLQKEKYYIKITDENCSRIDSVEVDHIPYDLSLSPILDSICTPYDFEIQTTILGADSFRINVGNAFSTNSDSTPFISLSTPNKYRIELLAWNEQCKIQDRLLDSITVLANALFIDPIPDTISCNLSPVELTLNSNGTANQFIWSSNGQFQDTLNNTLTDSAITVMPNNDQFYYVKLLDRFCAKEDTILVEQIRYDLALSPIIDSVCTPFDVELQTTILGLDSFRINYGNGLFTTNDSTPEINFSNQGVFDISLIGSNGRCNYNDTLVETINVYQDVQLESLVDTIVCAGEPIALSANTFGTAERFVWSTSPNFQNPINTPADSSISVAPEQTTTYYFRGQNVICFEQDQVQVIAEVVDIETEDFVSICIEDTINLNAFIIESRSPLSYQWEPISEIIQGQNSLNPLTAPKSDLKFYLQTESQIGCEDFDSVEVQVNLPAFDTALVFISQDSIYTGQTTNLSTDRNGGNLIYLWEPVEGLDNPNSANPTLTADSSKTYKVTITDLNTGCEVVAFKRLFVFEVNCAEPDIFVPSAFTPNDDLSNDILYVRGANLLEIEFQLFNRWGELVFETNDKEIGWDGFYQGKEVDPGVFVYQLRATCFDGQTYFTKGNVTLVR